MSILKNIVNKKNKGEIKSESVKYYESEVVGEKIELKKQPLSHYMSLVGDVELSSDNISDFIPVVNRLIFDYATMFRDPDAVEAAMAAYPDAKTPAELPEHIFEGNINEITEMFEIITSFYADMEGSEIEQARDDIKN